MLVGDVLTVVRRRLGDMKQQRWSDDQLILYTSLCQNDICIFTNFYKKVVLNELYKDTTIYDLPKDCIRVERIEYANNLVPILSRNSIDSNEAIYPCVLMDDLPYGKLEFRYNDDNTGIQLDITQVLHDAYGVVTDISWAELVDMYGVVSDIVEGEIPEGNPDRIGYYTLFYSAAPAILSSESDILVLPDLWITAFIHYVTGTALQDDNDASNIQRGDMELAKYARLLGEIFKATAKDFTTNYKTKLNTRYRRI